MQRFIGLVIGAFVYGLKSNLKGTPPMKANRFAVVVAFFVLVLTTSAAAQQLQSESIDEWDKMPADSVITFFGFGGPTGFIDDWNSFLAANGISFTTWDGFQYESTGELGMEYLWHGRNTGSHIAPYGVKLLCDAYRFVFAEPIYAIGATFFSTEDVDANIGVSTVYAYDQFGNIIGATKSSSLTEVNGPYQSSRPDVAGRPMVSSWAGVWSDIPIYMVDFTGVRLCVECVNNRTAFASFAFSRTPLTPDAARIESRLPQLPSSETEQ